MSSIPATETSSSEMTSPAPPPSTPIAPSTSKAAEDDNQLFKLKWNAHNNSIVHEFYDLFRDGEYSDVTVATDEESFHCHKMVLASCSDYFKGLFRRTPCKNPCIVLKDVSARHLAQLLRYMYVGEIDVLKEDLPQLLANAEYLQIK